MLDVNGESLLEYFPQGLACVWYGEDQVRNKFPDSSLDGRKCKVEHAIAAYPPQIRGKKPNKDEVADGRYRIDNPKQAKHDVHETYHLVIWTPTGKPYAKPTFNSVFLKNATRFNVAADFLSGITPLVQSISILFESFDLKMYQNFYRISSSTCQARHCD